jgi:hypothetical protein
LIDSSTEGYMSELPWQIQTGTSDLLRGLLSFAITHGIELLQKQNHLLPMVITFFQGSPNITVLTGHSRRPDLWAKEYVGNLPKGADAYVAILQGQALTATGMCDAIIVLAGEKSQEYGHYLALPYQRDTLNQVTAIGDPLYCDRIEQFLRQA